MEKAILIFDMPGSCNDCPLAEIRELARISYESYALRCQPTRRIVGTNKTNTIHPECPLKTLPKKKIVTADDTTAAVAVKFGWNNCIDEILREKDHGE